MPYPAAAKKFLAVPTPGVSEDITPVSDTRLVNDRSLAGAGFLVFIPYPKIALPTPYLAAAKPCLAVPTPGVSVATTPVLDIRLVNESMPAGSSN